MGRRVPIIRNYAEPEKTVTTLTVQSEHHVKHPSFAIGPQSMTAKTWLDDAVASCEALEEDGRPRVELRTYKLVQRVKDGPYEVVVTKTFARERTHAATAETKFNGKVDHGDATLLDKFMRGEAKLREDDVVAIAEAWANTTRPDSEACRSASKALNIRIAATRGVVIRGTDEAVI